MFCSAGGTWNVSQPLTRRRLACPLAIVMHACIGRRQQPAAHDDVGVEAQGGLEKLGIVRGVIFEVGVLKQDVVTCGMG